MKKMFFALMAVLAVTTVSAQDNGQQDEQKRGREGRVEMMAKELNLPVVVLAQLNRAAEQGERPQLANLRHFLRYLTVLLASGCVGGVVYLLVCGIFRAPELMELLSPLLRRVKKA